MKRLGARLILLSFLLFIYYSVVSVVIGLSSQEDFSSQENAVIILPIVWFLQTAVMSYPIIYSRWGGWKLVLAIFLILFWCDNFFDSD